MKLYNNIITLNKNSRGVYDLDTSKGCCSGLKHNKNGCYGECFANKYAKVYGYNFAISVNRNFESVLHIDKILNQIEKIDLPFIRIGVSGDPSENWNNTLQVLKVLAFCKKTFVIITKHWNNLTEKQLNDISKLSVCINTSISAFDSSLLLNNRLSQYNILKNYCKSVLRVVSCDFNTSNLTGLFLNDLQERLFNNDNVIDNVLRVSKNNPYLNYEIIKAQEYDFLKNKVLMSKKNKHTFTGYCKDCPDMCGINT
jgi:hypothetical protein